MIPDNVEEFLRMTEPKRKKLRCIYCDKKIRGEHVVTPAGPLHKQCVEDWDQHFRDAVGV